jgi:hypothetical protein
MQYHTGQHATYKGSRVLLIAGYLSNGEEWYLIQWHGPHLHWVRGAALTGD